MTFTISIKNAAEQKKLLELPIAQANCTIQDDIVIINNVYIPTKRVDDFFRYTLTISTSTNTIQLIQFLAGTGDFNDQPVTSSTHPKIVLILESPHKDEYDASNNPKAPAQSTTGDGIAGYILAIISSHQTILNLQGDYDLIICNPVQFQASLYAIHNTDLTNSSPAKALRNKAWQAIYTYEKCNFFARLTTYSPSIIINACTKELKVDVTKELRCWKCISGQSPTMYFASEHPSAWKRTTSLTPL